jgi:hypothetical protein
MELVSKKSRLHKSKIWHSEPLKSFWKSSVRRRELIKAQASAQAYEITTARTATKSIQFIHKPVFLFRFLPCCCFAFISKAATTKNRHFIYNLSMLCLGLGINWKPIISHLCFISFGLKYSLKEQRTMSLKKKFVIWMKLFWKIFTTVLIKTS